MKIINELPPNYKEIANMFKLHNGIVFTFGDTIYNPDGGFVDDFLMKHEETHAIQQQKMGIKEWWNKYLTDKNFRLSQELEAYQNQYKEAKKHLGKNMLFNLLKKIARDLSGEMYGNIIDFYESLEKIKQ